MTLLILNLMLMTVGPFAVLLPMAAAARLSFAGRRVPAYRVRRPSFAPRGAVSW